MSKFSFTIVLLILSVTAFAQQTDNATVVGTIADPSGATVAGAAIKLTHVTTNSTTEIRSNERDGKPNFSGIWQALNTANIDLQDHSARKDAPAGQSVVEGGEIPYQAWALAKKAENFKVRATADPEAKCYLLGVPRLTYSGHPFQIFQNASQGPNADPITILYEYAHANRFIYVNGTDHPKGPIEWWLDDSRGHWEGDTLVVDNVHFNADTWFDRAGDFHSEQLHVVERYTLTDPDHINYQATIEDQNVFTKPWNINMVLYRRKEKNIQILDYECYGFDIEKSYPFPSEGGN